MNKILIGLLFLFIGSHHLGAQILPKEGSKLNYRLIGFTFPSTQGGSKYKIEIANGSYTIDDSFRKNIIKSFYSNKNKIIGEVPSFGKEYTWRIVETNKNSDKKQSKLYHFSTSFSPRVDTDFIRLRVVKSEERYKDAYIMVDGTGVMYNMTGEPVWYLPNIEGRVWQEVDLHDLKLSPMGTVTYIHGEQVYEVNYNGDILWQGSNNGKVSGDTQEHYHHEFTRLNNGNYMALGTQYESWQLPSSARLNTSDNNIIRDSNNILRQIIGFGTLIEYDKQGNVVWSWKSSAYAKESDLYSHKTDSGRFDIDDIHANAFFFDEKSKVIYVSFRNISRIIKVQYPGGNVLKSYGEIYKADEKEKGNKLFCHQHCCRLSAEGNLYLYNNNDCNAGSLPQLVVFEKSNISVDTLKKMWEYDCKIDNNTGKGQTFSFNSWGSVFELPDQSMFVCMYGKGQSNGYNNIFIVNKNKRISWSAFPESRYKRDKKWKALPSYRASIISDRKMLENLIWNQETNQ